MVLNYLSLKKSSMSFKKYALLISALLTVSCTEKQEDISTLSGKYFVESLGENLYNKDLTQSTVVQISDGNYNHRYGSINSKLLGEAIVNRVNKYVKSDLEVYGIPTSDGEDITTLSSNGDLTKFKILPDGSISKTWQNTLPVAFCSELSTGIKDRVVVATCGSNSIFGFDLETGKKLWDTRVNDTIASKPLFTGNLAVFFAKNDAVYGINYNSGEIQWYVPNIINANNRSLFPVTQLLVDGYVIQQTYDDQVRGINAVNGQVEWISSISNQYKNVKGKEFLNHYGNITYDHQHKTIYLNNSSGSIVKLKIGSNKPDWIVPAVVSKPVWLLDNTILAVDDLGSVVAFSKFDGKKIWSNNILQKIIKKGDEKDIFGKPKPYNEISLTQPIVVDGMIIIISSNKKLIIISPENGRILEIKNYSQNIYGQPFSHNGKVYVMTDNGRTIVQL